LLDLVPDGLLDRLPDRLLNPQPDKLVLRISDHLRRARESGLPREGWSGQERLDHSTTAQEAAMGSSDERRLRAVVEQVTARTGFDLEELTVQAAGRRRIVRVVIDGDDGVSLDDAAAVSRAISEVLDADPDDPMGSAPYALEVTSPGIGRPLTLPRHFRRARTRLLAITTTDGRAINGHLLDATDSGVVLLTGKSGTDRLDLPFDSIARAKVEVEFGPPPAAVRELLGIADIPDVDLELDPEIDVAVADAGDVASAGSGDGSDEPGSELSDGTTAEQLSDQEAHR